MSGRAKKIKCDEEKPSCCRCIRLGLACSGYDASVSLKSSNLFLTFAIAGPGPPSRTVPGFVPSVLKDSSSSRGEKDLLLLGRQRYRSSHQHNITYTSLISLQVIARYSYKSSDDRIEGRRLY
jgi:hypothetical protein